MQRLNKSNAMALLDENERGMISKLADRCNCLEPLETRTCKAGDFTLIAKQSDIGNTKEIHLMSFFEDDSKYEYVADVYVSNTMDKSNYYQFLFNSVSNYKKDQKMTEDALNVYKENARNLFPGEELSYAFGGQLTISVLNKGDVNRVGQNKYVISLTVNFLKTEQEEIYEKDLFATIDKFYNAHKEDVALATKAQHIMKQCLNLSERGAAQFIYDHEYFVITRTTDEACKFDLSYGNTKEGFVRAKQKCLQDKDFENSVIGLTPLLLSKNIYEYLQKCEMTKFLSDEAMKAMTESPLAKPEDTKDDAKDAKPADAKAEPKKENGDSKEEPKKDADASKEEPKKDAAATEQKK